MAKAWAERLPSGNYSGRFRHPLTGRKERAGTHPDKDLALAAARRALREVTRLYDGDPDVCPVSGAPTLAEYAAEAINALPHVRRSTRSRYQTIARVLIKHFGEKIRVDQLAESSARELVAACNHAGLAHATIELRLGYSSTSWIKPAGSTTPSGAPTIGTCGCPARCTVNATYSMTTRSG